MEQRWIDQWNNRYSQEAYAYGKLPNAYLQEQIDKLTPGLILFPAEGEGRNAVYAARRGWTVWAFDISQEGQKKALQLAAEHHVHIHYLVGGIETLDNMPDAFDAMALIYAHIPPDLRFAYHQALDKRLKPGGIIIFEAFSKKHVDYVAKNEKVGGPREPSFLFSMDEIKSDFAHYTFLELQETEIELREGLYHNGLGCVIRFVARKK